MSPQVAPCQPREERNASARNSAEFGNRPTKSQCPRRSCWASLWMFMVQTRAELLSEAVFNIAASTWPCYPVV